MLVLDTNHFREWERDTPPGKRLRARLQGSKSELALTVATVQEVMRGWLAEINRYHDLDDQIVPYAQFQRVVEGLGEWLILSWDGDSAALFRDFRRQNVRIGTMDLKIACIVLAHDATLLTRNTGDFAQVPGLRFEDWLD